MTDDIFVEEIVRGQKIYHGKLIVDKCMIGTGKHQQILELDTPGFLLDVRAVLILLLVPLLDAGKVKMKKPSIDIRFFDWFDETSALDHGLLAWLLGFIYDDDIFESHTTFAEATST